VDKSKITISQDKRRSISSVLERSLIDMIIIVVLVIVVTLIGLALVLGISMGLGWLLTLFLPFTLFEASLLAMGACVIVGALWYNVIRSLSDFAPDLYPHTPDKDEEYSEYDEIPASQFYKTKSGKTWEAWFRYQIANDIYMEFQDAPNRVAPMGQKQLQALAIRLSELAISMLKAKTARTKKLRVTKNALRQQMVKIGQQPYDDDILSLALAGINENVDFYYEDLIEVIRDKAWDKPTDMFETG
jgi:hypothetical protein